jgi:apolipoprotein N-acyltransferase
VSKKDNRNNDRGAMPTLAVGMGNRASTHAHGKRGHGTPISRFLQFGRSTLGQGLLGAALLWAAFPPLDLWLLAWVAPIPWILLIRRRQLAGRRPYTMLALAGFAFWMAVLHFLRLPHWATSFGWVALSFYFAFYQPLFVGLSRVAVHRLRVPVILAAPVVWTGLELARAHLLTGMSMASLGHTQYRWIDLIQLSDLAGAYGVGFVVMFVAAALARMLPAEKEDRHSCLSLEDRHSCLSVGRQECLSSSGKQERLSSPDRQECLSSSIAFWPVLPAIAVVAAALLYGHLRISLNSTRAGPKIALIQGSIDTEMRYDPGMRNRIFKEYYKLSKDALAKDRNIDLVVWPETMFTEPLVTFDADAARPLQFEGTDAEFQKQLRQIGEQDRKHKSTMAWTAQTLGVPLLVGVDANHFAADGMQCFNSAAYVARDGRLLGRYDKMHLVMFGEYVPLADHFPWLQRLTPLPISVTPGRRPAAFDLCWGGSCTAVPKAETEGQQYNCRPNNVCRLAPNICYETVLSQVIRGQVNRLAAEGHEPDVLVNLTNDGWFWGSSALDLHLICGVFRAVECRKPLLIAANTGFSAWIDSDGNIREQGPRRATDVIVAEPRFDRSRRSWYLAHGDWFAGVCLAACGLFALVGLQGRRSIPPAERTE